MQPTSTVAPTVSTLQVPGARLHYEVRGHGPLIALVAAPMNADAFAPLADLLAVDHTVLTTDPRGIGRSPVDDPQQDSTPEIRGDDIARLLAHLDAGPAVLLGSSGGAVSALAAVQARPDLVHTLIAHEPPLDELLDDRAELRTRTEQMCAAYLAGDVAGAWGMFMSIAGIDMPPSMIEQFFLADRRPQTVADEHYQFAHMLRPTVFWQPDVAALRAAPTRIVVGVGVQSAGQLCDRASTALAGLLGTAPTPFPGDHTGFAGQSEAFAARLRAVLGDQ